MSNVSGTISVNVEFRDTTTSAGVQSLKTVTLREATEYTTGKVALVTGTVGTASVTISSASVPYTNAAGLPVSFASLQRIVFQSSRPCVIEDGGNALTDQTLATFFSSGHPDISIQGNFTAGTASYTLVLYGT